MHQAQHDTASTDCMRAKTSSKRTPKYRPLARAGPLSGTLRFLRIDFGKWANIAVLKDDMWLGMFWTRLKSGWSVFSKEEQVVATIIEIANVVDEKHWEPQLLWWENIVIEKRCRCESMPCGCWYTVPECQDRKRRGRLESTKVPTQKLPKKVLRIDQGCPANLWEA